MPQFREISICGWCTDVDLGTRMLNIQCTIFFPCASLRQDGDVSCYGKESSDGGFSTAREWGTYLNPTNSIISPLCRFLFPLDLLFPLAR